MSFEKSGWLRKVQFAFGACVMLLCASVTIMVANNFARPLVHDAQRPHVAFGWYPLLLCLLVGCIGLGFTTMQRAEPTWLRHSSFVMGAAVVVLCSVGAAVVILMDHHDHFRSGWFLMPMLVLNIGLGMKLMWRNGKGKPLPRFGAGARAQGW